MTSTEQLSDYATRRAMMDNAFDECGIGHDWRVTLSDHVSEIAEFCAAMQSRIVAQAVHNLTINVPCGIMRREQATARAAIEQAVPCAIGAFVDWSIDDAIEFAARILEDVNAHKECAALLAMRQGGAA